MKHLFWTMILIFSLGLAACQGGSAETSITGCPSGYDKSAVVFDVVTLCATSDVSQEKLTHAANVTAEWLDNDEDGVADEPRLLEALKKNNPIMDMSSGGFFSGGNFPDDARTQGLFADETKPEGDRRDASQEEIHHLIMNAGWQSLFPAIFSEQKSDNSTLYQAWKFADDNGHYTYNDPTCNDSCKVTEFVYLATAAYLGSPKDLESDEMRLKTRDALRQTIPSVIEIFESVDYVYPTDHWPDGTYMYPNKITFHQSAQ